MSEESIENKDNKYSEECILGFLQSQEDATTYVRKFHETEPNETYGEKQYDKIECERFSTIENKDGRFSCSAYKRYIYADALHTEEVCVHEFRELKQSNNVLEDISEALN